MLHPADCSKDAPGALWRRQEQIPDPLPSYSPAVQRAASQPSTELGQHVPPPADSLGAGLEDKQAAEPTKQLLAAWPPICLLHTAGCAPSTQTKCAPVFLCPMSLGPSQRKSCWFYHSGNVFSLEVEQCRREDACRWQPGSTAQCLCFSMENRSCICDC